MTATVIEFRLRRIRAAGPAALVRLARGSMSREGFAAALSTQLGWTAKPGMIRAWESGVPVPQDVMAVCRAGVGGDASPIAHAGDETEADARNVIAWVESTSTADDTIDYLALATAKAAEDHTRLPPAAMLPQVRQLHAMVQTLLHRGRQRLHQTRDLLRLDAELLAHMCQLLGDVHRDQAASACGQAALVLADEAGSSPAAALSAQAQVARWHHRCVEAADLAAEGFTSSSSASLRVLLACQEANAAAAAGQARRARAAIARAEASERAVADSAWSCPPARYALYRVGVALNLGDPKEALRQAAEAESLWQGNPPRAFGTWSHFQIAVAKAHLMLGSVDGAAQHIAPVLSLPPEYRLSTVVEHVSAVDALLRQRRFSGSTQAAAVHEQLAQFANGAAARTG